MKYTTTPGIEKKWSKITLGCWQLAPTKGWGDLTSPQDAELVIKTALDAGITAFDTAEGYSHGESERRLGKALGNRNNDVIVISKIWPDAELTLEAYQERLNNSLKALNREYVDVALIHWPGDYFNTEEKSQKLSDIMLALKQSGKATLIGLSNFHKVHLDLLGKNISNFSINQVPYNLLEREYEGETLDICIKNKLQYMAYSPTAKGLLARRLSEKDLAFPARQHDDVYSKTLYPRALKVFEVAESIAKEINAKPINVVLAWVLERENILTAIVGSRKQEQVLEFAKTTRFKLSNLQNQRLTEASDEFGHYK